MIGARHHLLLDHGASKGKELFCAGERLREASRLCVFSREGGGTRGLRHDGAARGLTDFSPALLTGFCGLHVEPAPGDSAASGSAPSMTSKLSGATPQSRKDNNHNIKRAYLRTTRKPPALSPGGPALEPGKGRPQHHHPRLLGTSLRGVSVMRGPGMSRGLLHAHRGAFRGFSHFFLDLYPAALLGTFVFRGRASKARRYVVGTSSEGSQFWSKNSDLPSSPLGSGEAPPSLRQGLEKIRQ